MVLDLGRAEEKKFLRILQNYKDEKNKKEEDDIEKMNAYNLNYERKRLINDEAYINYYQTYVNYKENWLKTNKENDLEKLKNLKKPKLLEVDDIYTYMIIKNKRFKN